MKLKIDQKIIGELKKNGYDVEYMVERIKVELEEYDFEGSTLFDLFFDYNGERTLAQGRVKEDIAHCYGLYTKIKIIESEA